ncbi:RNA-directed DNA polymerase-like protein [Striga asiatica]|uniref:RNA-directed DNA polymerase-like protein n=1 Tax=Striga asiatica TaxID=4170 RepID=A0A5A7NXH9_STRAF|nr:RNA-directed DNA polymerase-like protein [Striga asiatica]
MRVLVWNCKGLGGPSTISQLKDNVRAYLPDFIFLSETKKKKSFVTTVCKNLLVGDRWKCVDPIGSKGGLLLCWSSKIQVLEVVDNNFCFEVKFLLNGFADPMWGVFIYASVDPYFRQKQWELLIRHHLTWGNLWFIGGDFNDILSNDEKNGGLVRGEASFQSFRHFTQLLNSVACPSVGHPFTWSNNRKGKDFVEVQLDRFLLSPDWLLKFPKVSVLHIPLVSSDHSLLLMDIVGTEQKRKHRFYFDRRWAKEEGFDECVKKAWKMQVTGAGLYSFQKRLRNVKFGLLGWLTSTATNSSKIIKECNAKLELLSSQGGAREWTEWYSCKEKIHKAYKDEELYWKQKARVRWLKEGDNNTRFFQACVNQRRSMNSLENLLKRTAGRCTNQAEVVEEVSNFFEQLFSYEYVDGDSEILQGLPCVITAGMNQDLTKAVDEMEIKNALWAMDPGKAPGIDGFSPSFFQSCWHIIKTDLCLAVQNSFVTGCIPKATNHTVITLIPKTKYPKLVTDYRPISLCTITYRLIAKILALRIKSVIKFCISQSQTAFVPDRQILDNVIIANECLHFLKGKKRGKKRYMALKLDMAKAFDRVEWPLLLKSASTWVFAINS